MRISRQKLFSIIEYLKAPDYKTFLKENPKAAPVDKLVKLYPKVLALSRKYKVCDVPYAPDPDVDVVWNTWVESKNDLYWREYYPVLSWTDDNYHSDLYFHMPTSTWIEIDGERYTVHTENQLKTGEYVASDTLLKGDKHNYSGLLAILCRKEGELYDSKFEAEVLEDRIKLFEKQPITKILCIIGFFLQLYITSMTPTLLSSKVREAIDLTRKDIETSAKNGEVSKRSMRSAIRKLRKLEKSINSI